MKIFGTHDEATVKQLQNCVEAESGALGVLCADGHRGYAQPVGGVVAYQNFISPSGVGYDIGCGNMAIRTKLKAADISEPEWNRIADEVQKRIAFGLGRANQEKVDKDLPIFQRIAQAPTNAQRSMLQLAIDQLGTVGSGNHYVDILTDEQGVVWIACHFGSRGFGWKTCNGFLAIAQGKDFFDHAKEPEDPVLFNVSGGLGTDYIEAMTIAGEYAYAGRRHVCLTVADIMGTLNAIDFTVHNHHNYAWKERHGSSDYWVVRKGATPAFPGQQGFVGGSMGDICVILEGVESKESIDALYSTVHGAGRVMSRRAAAGKSRIVSRWQCQNYRKCSYSAAKGGYHKEEGGPTPKCPECGHKLRLSQMKQQMSKGAVDWDEVRSGLRDKGLILRGGGADEAPQVYRSLASVLDAHKDTIKVLHTLTPKVVVMAGEDVYDPYKD